MKKLFLPNRIAVYLNVIAGIAAALAPIVATLDLTSTVGIVGGLAAVTAVLNNYIRGYQRHEDRVAWADVPVSMPDQASPTEPADEPEPEPAPVILSPDAPTQTTSVVLPPAVDVPPVNADGSAVQVTVNGHPFVAA